MAHPKQLIDRIAAEVMVDYPRDAGYDYVFEKAIKSTRMMPDILVRQQGRLICAVEIGYTRPEKLTAYRHTLHIPDVRWYDKAGHLHDHAQVKVIVEETVKTLTLKAEPLSDIYTYRLLGQIPCVDCPVAAEECGRLVSDRSYDRFIRRFGEDAARRRDEAIDQAEHDWVYTLIVTDYVSLWLPSYCDACGRNWLADAEAEGMCLADMCAFPPREVSRLLGAREVVSWEAASAEVLNTFGFTMSYLDGQFIHPENADTIWRHMQANVRAYEVNR